MRKWVPCIAVVVVLVVQMTLLGLLLVTGAGWAASALIAWGFVVLIAGTYGSEKVIRWSGTTRPVRVDRPM